VRFGTLIEAADICLAGSTEGGMKRIVVTCVGFLLLIIVGFGLFYYRRTRDKNQTELELQRYEVLRAEKTYVDRVLSDLSGGGSVKSSQLSVFVCEKTINEMLSGLVGLSGSIPNIQNATFHVVSVSSQFRDGFPQVTIDLNAEKPEWKIQVRVAVVAVLVPTTTQNEPGKVNLGVRVIGLQPVVDWNHLEGRLGGFARDVLQVKAAEFSKMLPPIPVPLSSEFPVELPASEQAITFPVPAGSVTGIISVPAIQVSKTLYVDRLLFLSDGLHVFMSMQSGHQIAQEEFALGDVTRPSLVTPAGANAQLAKQIDLSRQGIDARAVGVRVNDSNLQVWISKSLLDAVSGALAALTPASRHLHFRTTGKQGQLVSTGGGAPFGCGYYAEIAGNSANADLDLTTIQSNWTSDGAIDINAGFSSHFSAQINGHGNSVPGLCMVKNMFGISAPDVAGGLQCRCPTGGGIGSSVGVQGEKGGTLSVRVSLRSDQANWLSYDLALTGPPALDVTVAVDLGRIGSLGVPVSFPLPLRTLSSGLAPPLFSGAGTVELPNVHFKRSYRVVVSPKKGTADADGFTIDADVSLQWEG
jgi:hypothetical protein